MPAPEIKTKDSEYWDAINTVKNLNVTIADLESQLRGAKGFREISMDRIRRSENWILDLEVNQ
jgi:hypothetical protein